MAASFPERDGRTVRGGAAGSEYRWASRGEPGILLGIVILAAVLRAWRLADLPWESDELYTLRDARDLGAYATATGAPGIWARPLYYLLQRALLEVLPASHLGLRLVPALFGVAGVWATWWLARTVFWGRAGLVAALLVALSPWHLYASQFARYWSLVYLLSAFGLGAVIRAVDQDSTKGYVLAALILVVGIVTHPTFVLPFVGAAVAVYLIAPDGAVQFKLPTARAIRLLWGPVAGIAIAGVVTLVALGRSSALHNAATRELAASLRLIPAMLQWMGPSVAAALIGGLLCLAWVEPATGRRWAGIAALGLAGSFLLLFGASFGTAVYSDYGIAGLPLVFCSIGGAVELLSRALRRSARGPFVAAAVGALVVAGSPETISHLSDGSRFDYRPAFALIRSLGAEHPVYGLIDEQRAAYAPDLRYRSLAQGRRLPTALGFWLVTSVRRYGLREGTERFQAWIDINCRRVGRFERPRLDYRLYRTELHWCGATPVPGIGGPGPR